MPRSEVLHAWIENEYVGYFEKQAGQISFRYEPGAKHAVSLSLPKDGSGTKMAAANYLAGLTPETSEARESMREALGAKSANTWELLSADIIDLPGGILLTPSKEPAHRGVPFTRVATLNSIEAKLMSIHHDGADTSGAGAQRFSLAGVQAKFAIVRDDEEYFWPDGATPSTHIFKPATKTHAGLNEVEARALSLAEAMGLDAAAARVLSFGEYETFATERFDRAKNTDGTYSRLHMEDFAQALGRSPESKYSITAAESVKLLKGQGEGLDYEFVKQLAFNVAIGNADAHAKNYSLMHRDGKVSLSPLYDTVPIALFPAYSQKLSMKIGSESILKGVVPANWAQLARTSSLDQDLVLDIVRETNEKFLNHADRFLGDTELGHSRKTELEALFFRAERTLKLMS